MSSFCKTCWASSSCICYFYPGEEDKVFALSGWNSFLAILHVSCCSHYWGIRVIALHHFTLPLLLCVIWRFRNRPNKPSMSDLHNLIMFQSRFDVCICRTFHVAHTHTHTHSHNRWEDRTSLWISSVPSSLSRPPSLRLCDALPLLGCRLVRAPANVHVFGVRKETEAVLLSAYRRCLVCEEHFMCVKTILCYNEYL